MGGAIAMIIIRVVKSIFGAEKQAQHDKNGG